MPTFIPQDDVIVSLDGTGGTLVDISSSTKSVALDPEVTVGRFATLGQRFQNSTEGTSMVKGSLTIYTTVGATEPHYIISHWLFNDTATKAGLKSLRIQDPDASAGSFQWDMEIRPASYNEVVKEAGEANPGEHQLAFEVDGAPTWTVIS